MNTSKIPKNLLKHLAPMIAAILLCQGQAAATPVLDGNVAPGATSYCTDGCEWQQEITAGITGKLTAIKLFGNTTGDLRIANGHGFVTGSWEAAIHGAAIDGSLIDLSAYDIYVTAGQTFVIDLSNFVGSNSYGVRGNFGRVGTDALWVIGHDGFLLNYTQLWGPNQIAYQTYVDSDTAPGGSVPEPAVLSLLGLGLLGVGVSRRASRR